MPERCPSKPISYTEQVILFALMTSLIALSIDAMLPALAAIEADLMITDPNGRQYIVVSLFAGLALGFFIFGPISDSMGRKGPIYVGFGIFMVGCLLSIFSTSFEVMLVGRFLQGLGAAAPRVISIAIIRDQFEGRAMARFMSLVMTVFILVPVLAPGMGQIMIMVLDWRAIFWAMFILGVITSFWFALRQVETLPAPKRSHFSVSRIRLSIAEILTNRTSFGFTILAGFVFSSFLVYLSTAQQIFQDQYGVGDLFPVYFGALALAVGGASFTNSALVMKLGMRNLVRTALWALSALSAVYLVVALLTAGQPPLWSLMIYLLFLFFCLGILFGNVNAMAMEPMGHIAGIASAVVSSISTVQSVIIGTLIAQTYDGTILPLVSGFFGLGLVSLVVFYVTDRKSSPAPSP
ncbi:multidrug effflux MFS transporter [Sneathiella chinensis]|uniref:Bcr/CflA family efflux transporter n=1 Tax=Sneathiella chinensis TaxID=349750 RepID=A0ABQ5U2N6_9PROT|nr:multidrug effflux MFS transporter [Sneathiella chinensis]GLQ05529.1 Bcr/CflA family drug resistance efflux transporter [Sneathiella chinensis]